MAEAFNSLYKGRAGPQQRSSRVLDYLKTAIVEYIDCPHAMTRPVTATLETR
jgi:hypothetical protein